MTNPVEVTLPTRCSCGSLTGIDTPDSRRAKRETRLQDLSDVFRFSRVVWD